MQLNELVTDVAVDHDVHECPFDHNPVKGVRKNVLPPPSTANNSKKLRENLESLHLQPTGVRLENGEAAEVQYTGHHLLPGNEAWPRTKLLRWVAARQGHVSSDIGFDVNCARNGVSLPGHEAARSWTQPAYKVLYAFAAMGASSPERQFHDRHPAYSDFVVQCLDKIAQPLNERLGGSAGCGKKDCPGNRSKPKFEPPYNLLERLFALAERLAKRLSQSPQNWRAPIITSRLALMYARRELSQESARDALRVRNFDYGSPKK